MDNIQKTFNIYCDESCHLENDHKKYMFIGSISCAYNQVKIHSDYIKQLKLKHHFFAEIKWTSVSQSKLRFYEELIDYFFSTDLKFRIVGVDKSKINNERFDQTFDEFYYKMFYQLINHMIDTRYKYNVYLDIKDKLSAHKLKKVKKILNVQYGVVNKVQNIMSHESLLLQLADLIIGAISYVNNNKEKANHAKMQIIAKIQKHSNYSLCSTNYSPKLNLFFIELR